MALFVHGWSVHAQSIIDIKSDESLIRLLRVTPFDVLYIANNRCHQMVRFQSTKTNPSRVVNEIEAVLNSVTSITSAESRPCFVRWIARRSLNYLVIDESGNLYKVCRDEINRPICMKNNVAEVSCGVGFTLIRNTAGECFAVGNEGSQGQLGLGNGIQTSDVFIKINFSDQDQLTISSISAGDYHSAAVDMKGRVFVWGSNAYHRLGLPISYQENGNAEDISSNGIYFNVFTPVLLARLDGVGNNRGIKFISCGCWHTIAVAQSTNDIYGWGYNKYGQLGVNDSSSEQIQTVTLAEHHEFIIEEPERINAFDCHLDDRITPEESNIMKVISGSTYTSIITESGRVLVIGGFGCHMDANQIEIHARELGHIPSYLSIDDSIIGYDSGLAFIADSSS